MQYFGVSRVFGSSYCCEKFFYFFCQIIKFEINYYPLAIDTRRYIQRFFRSCGGTVTFLREFVTNRYPPFPLPLPLPKVNR
jgi:hypothetical protein